MAKDSSLGILAILGLAMVLLSKKTAFQPGGYSYFQLTGILPHERIITERKIVMPTFPDYPQVNGAGPRLDPTRVDYEEALAEKYPDELEATRVSYQATRKVLGLRQYTAPPMPITSRGR